MVPTTFIRTVLEYLPKIANDRNIHTTPDKLKSFKKYLDYSKVPKINNKDLEIQYVRGWGPGGQATNKTNNAVVLKHIPTGIVVKCHQTRSQSRNKEIAQEILINKLDTVLNGDESIENQEKRILKQKSLQKKRKQMKLAALKKTFKEREGID